MLYMYLIIVFDNYYRIVYRIAVAFKTTNNLFDF